MKKYKLLILSAVAAFATYSCDDYLDVNTSPNAPSASNVTPDLMLAAALNQPYEEMANRANELGNVFMNSWAGDVNNITGAYLNEFALILTSNFHTDVWDQLYRNTGTLTTIANNTDPQYNNVRAIAMVMKVYYFQTIVDVYGDAPYTEAHLLGENTTPTYDDDEAIYRDFIVKLDEAINLIDNSSSSLNPGANDIIFGGDMSMWKKFANTMKLRVLLREATKAETNANSATYLNTQFANMTGAQFVDTNVTMNPGYENVEGRQNPLYANFGLNADGSATFDNGLIVPTDYAAKFMLGQVTQNGISTNTFDGRLERMYTQIGGVVTGVIQGEDNTNAPAELSHLLEGGGIINSATQDSYIMTESEARFLKAEAIERGYITGDAATEYTNGIIASFNLLGATGAAAYTTSPSPIINYASAPNKIEAIMTQKWIALMGINGIESWIEYTRTGFPAIPLATTAQQAAKPNRLLYPGSEYTANAANVPTQSNTDAFTTHVFWDEN